MRSLYYLLITKEAFGPVNVVAPETLSQEKFAEELAAHFGKKVHFTIPAWFLKMAFDGMADELLLSCQNASCEKLQSLGFSFEYPTLRRALEKIL